jgi:hypothetical protein
MAANFLRLTHENKDGSTGSILIDKIDRSQGNFEGYAQKRKQKVYIPGKNPADLHVKGYIDLVPTDEVLLSWNHGTIRGLIDSEYISASVVSTSQTLQPIVSSAGLEDLDVNLGIEGLNFTSINPDVTYLYVINPSGKYLRFSAFLASSSTSLLMPVSLFSSLGTWGPGWSVKVMANSKLSAAYTA